MATTEGTNSDVFTFMPLGAGQEVGRSCHYMTFKGKKIMFDCGIHPGMQDFAALPFVDLIDAESLDLLLITHFHLDHCGALPWLLNKTGFRGRCFMTPATKAIYRMLLGDYIKMSKFGGSNRQAIFTEQELDKSMDKIEVIGFHEQKEVNGIKFWPYVAGHVLGAAMFMIEIAGIRALYTGDFSVHETRHLCGAEIPQVTPDILIAESTCGTQVHEGREQREKRFTSMVHDVVSRGGRCLIPVFAVGPAQELMLILDEYWEAHPELSEIPIYYASALARKCMSVYQTFSSGMNRSIQAQIERSNPFVFKHVSNLKSIEHFEDAGPCVVLASPGMLQNGLSRELFEKWCTDAKNGCVIAGYCVEGTLARHILSEPEEIQALAGHRLPMRLQVLYISFSAHADYSETSNFVHKMKPAHLILVHGEMNEMNRLKAAILRQYEEDQDYKIEVHNPRNTETLSLFFRGQKTAKIVGQLAENLPPDNSVVSGILLRRNFNYHLLMPSDLSVYTELSTSSLTQKKSLYYDGELAVLVYNLSQLTEDYTLCANEIVDDGPSHVINIFDDKVKLSYYADKKVVVLEWTSTPVTDMYSDALMSVILHAQMNPIPLKYLPESVKGFVQRSSSSTQKALSYPISGTQTKLDAFTATVMEICGDGSEISSQGTHLVIRVDGKEAQIDSQTMQIKCDDDLLHHLLSAVCQKISQALAPIGKS